MEFKHISAYIFITASSPVMEYNRNQELNERERERERTEELEMQRTYQELL